MTKNDQIPFVYYNIDDDVNKPFYYKLHVSETDTFGFVGSIIDTLLPNSGYEFAYWTADATVYQAGSGTAIPAGTPLSSDQLQNKVTVKSDVTFTAHFKQSSKIPRIQKSPPLKSSAQPFPSNPAMPRGQPPSGQPNSTIMISSTSAGSNLKTTNPLPPGTPTTTPTALCPPSPHLKTARPMCIPSC